MGTGCTTGVGPCVRARAVQDSFGSGRLKGPFFFSHSLTNSAARSETQGASGGEWGGIIAAGGRNSFFLF